MKPLLGIRLYKGICPPSNPGLTPPPERAFCPLCPLPAVFPFPEPCPRPLLKASLCLDPVSYTHLDVYKRQIVITLKYGADKNEKIITGLKRISKPGLRVYAGAEELPKVLGGLGIAIISTNKGLLTDKEARKQNVGGEVLAFVW